MEGETNKQTLIGDIENDMLFRLPQKIKDIVSKDINPRKDWGSDYLSKVSNIQKYIYYACESIQTAGISHLSYSKELTAHSNERLNTGMGEVYGRYHEINVRLSYRRMVELFIESIHLLKVKEDKEAFLRFFFLTKNLKMFVSRYKSHEKYFSLPLQFDKKVISELRSVLSTMTIESPFHLKVTYNLNNDSDILSGRFLESTRKLFDDALPYMTDDQRLLVGETYHAFGETSDVIHGFSGGVRFNLDDYHKEILAIHGRIILITSSILKNLLKLGDHLIEDEDLKQYINIFGVDESLFTLEINDVVTVKNVAEGRIINIDASDKFGNKKYKIEYTSPLRFEEEWFLLKDLTKK